MTLTRDMPGQVAVTVTVADGVGTLLLDRPAFNTLDLAATLARA